MNAFTRLCDMEIAIARRIADPCITDNHWQGTAVVNRETLGPVHGTDRAAACHASNNRIVAGGG